MSMKTLYYFKDHDLGGDFSLADRAGIPLDQRTGDPEQALQWPGPLIVFDGWDQPEKFSMVWARGTKPTRLIYDYSYEAGVGDRFVKDYLDRARAQGITSDRIGWILNRSAQDSVRAYPNCCIDYFALDAVWRWQQGRVRVNDQPLAGRPSQYLCLLGKLNQRSVRMECLWEIWRQGLGDRTQLGLLATPEDLAVWHQRMVPWNRPEFWQWLKPRLGALDQVQIDPTPQGLTSKGYPYNPEIYSESRVTIICETVGPDLRFDPRFITEKTYRPMMNLSLWCLIALPGTLAHLESLGFRTWRDRLRDTEYGLRPRHSVRSAVLASQELMQLSESDPLTLDQDLIHNQQTLIKLAQLERARLRQFLDLEPDPTWSENLRG